MSRRPRMTQRKRHITPTRLMLLTQLVFVVAFATAWMCLPGYEKQALRAELKGTTPPVTVPLRQSTPVRVASLYDDATVISDEELAAVLQKVLPRFDRIRMRPNYVEHALRIWGGDIEFNHPDLISGPEMVRFLTDSDRYIASWRDEAEPILLPQGSGVAIRWGPDRTASVHHDHLLTCLTEAGVALDTDVYLPHQTMHVRDLLTEAISDFRLDEREVEWSVMAFGYWLAPEHIREWRNADRRVITFDLLARRLMRDHKRHGICLGTHRTYSLVILLRLNEEFGGNLLQPSTLSEIAEFLDETRQLVMDTPNDDGSWPPNWYDGSNATERADPQAPFHRRVIATGHHLEWLAIAPERFHPPRQRIREAARWAIENTIEMSQDVIDDNYTYYSHVGNALALWRGTTPAEFWQSWRSEHPEIEHLNAGGDAVSALDSEAPSGDH